jgi:hypothetical protein
MHRSAVLSTIVLSAVVIGVGASGLRTRAQLPQPAPPGAQGRAAVTWYTHPADKWENALPVGNGRLWPLTGTMICGFARRSW